MADSEPDRHHVTRRRFMATALLSTSGLVIQVPQALAHHKDVHEEGGEPPGDVPPGPPDPNGYCTPGSKGTEDDWRPNQASEEIPYPPNGDWAGYSPGSHFSSSPRAGMVMVHHAGSPNSHQNGACNSCDVPGDHTYDFCIARNGNICNTGRWSQQTGAHAYGCNSCSVGIMLQGCFGGCSSGNISQPSDEQICSLAFLSLHLQAPNNLAGHRPHARCHHINCSSVSNPTVTACCGTNLATHNTGNHWKSLGQTLMERMLTYRANLANGCTCQGQCPV